MHFGSYIYLGYNIRMLPNFEFHGQQTFPSAGYLLVDNTDHQPFSEESKSIKRYACVY
jgi:hypothetical protein